MKIIILGSGQAEYEIAQLANQKLFIEAIFAVPGNADTARLKKVRNVAISMHDNTNIQQFMEDEKIHLCITDAASSKALFEQEGESEAAIPPSSLSPSDDNSISYAQSGVSIDEGNSFVDRIKPLVKSTYRKEALSSIGGFSGAFKIPKTYKDPLLIAATDGVGTKLKIAIELQQHHSIGIDLVAMCVNDLIVCGAEPLFFLDYYATAKLDSNIATEVIAGICEGCKLAGCSLIGGETAEMPGMYQANDYDLAGFSVGVVENNEVLDGSNINVGDCVLALPSSGIHSNGYSLVRAVLEHAKPSLQQAIGEKTLAQWLLTPTTIYVKDILDLKKNIPIKGLAHITGGGLVENIPRVLPANVAVQINSNSWQVPAIFQWLQQQGNIEEQEMWRVFNMGIGMVIILSAEYQQQALQQLKECGAFVIGNVIEKDNLSEQCIIS
jgi:phosphoribosylformylglycinamidine cyclo-ligase